MSKETIIRAKINLLRDMIFKCDMGEMKFKDFYIDETNKKEIDKLGPTPAKLLAMALLGCLSASFIHCLKLRKFSLDNLEAEAEVEIRRNKKGFVRVTKISVDLKPTFSDPAAIKRAEQCKKIFERYCTVTAAVREGINIEVNVDY